MSEPRRRIGKNRLIAAAIFVTMIAGGLYLQSRPPAAPPTTEAAPASAPRPVVETSTFTPLGRADLLEIANAAADAYAAGSELPGRHVEAIGRRFIVSLPFGCQGPASPGSTLPERWEYDVATSKLRVHVEPQIWTDAPWLRAITGDAAFEAAEGFWIRRPWQRSSTCPPFRSPLDAPASIEEPRQTVALVELFSSQGSRVLRRDGRPYEVTRKMPASELDMNEGFRLVVEGRLTALPNGKPAWCWSEDVEKAPICAVAVTFDQVRIEGQVGVLGQWQR